VVTCVRRQCLLACLYILQCTHENTPPPRLQHDARPCHCRHQSRRPFRQVPPRPAVRRRGRRRFVHLSGRAAGTAAIAAAAPSATDIVTNVTTSAATMAAAATSGRRQRHCHDRHNRRHRHGRRRRQLPPPSVALPPTARRPLAPWLPASPRPPPLPLPPLSRRPPYGCRRPFYHRRWHQRHDGHRCYGCRRHLGCRMRRCWQGQRRQHAACPLLPPRRRSGGGGVDPRQREPRVGRPVERVVHPTGAPPRGSGSAMGGWCAPRNGKEGVPRGDGCG